MQQGNSFSFQIWGQKISFSWLLGWVYHGDEDDEEITDGGMRQVEGLWFNAGNEEGFKKDCRTKRVRGHGCSQRPGLPATEQKQADSCAGCP